MGAYAEPLPWVHREAKISLTRLLANVAPDGAAPGSVVASPSRADPDYYFHWIRDAALAMNALAAEARRTNNGDLIRILTDFARFSRRNQLAPAISGLGEPKFHMDGRDYREPWGRPQNDGPALRAIALIQLAELLLEKGDEAVVRNLLYDGRMPTQSVIKADLEYVTARWRDPTFDLWEEVLGRHFYTKMVQRKALILGARLADRLGDGGAAAGYRRQAKEMEPEIVRHRSDEKGIVLVTLDPQRLAALRYRPVTFVARTTATFKPSGLDAAIVLAALHGDTGDGFFGPSSDWILGTAFRLEQSFRRLYAVNGDPAKAPGIGRYPEDEYFGGNPWFLTTLAFAELYVKAAGELERSGKVAVTSQNVPLLSDILSRAGVGSAGLEAGAVLVPRDGLFEPVVRGLRDRSTAFLERVRLHLDAEGGMAEQFSRSNGYQLSARDLTWNYTAFLSAFRAYR